MTYCRHERFTISHYIWIQCMNKKQCIIACATINISFIFAQIYKHTQMVKYTYAQQQHDKTIVAHEQTIQELTQQLYALKDRETIRLFAKKELSMQPLVLKNIKRLTTS